MFVKDDVKANFKTTVTFISKENKNISLPEIDCNK